MRLRLLGSLNHFGSPTLVQPSRPSSPASALLPSSRRPPSRSLPSMSSPYTSGSASPRVGSSANLSQYASDAPARSPEEEAAERLIAQNTAAAQEKAEPVGNPSQSRASHALGVAGALA